VDDPRKVEVVGVRFTGATGTILVCPNCCCEEDLEGFSKMEFLFADADRKESIFCARCGKELLPTIFDESRPGRCSSTCPKCNYKNERR
jgi:hypothetical protein